MRNTKIEANRLRLARLRYFDEAANAVEIPSEEAYAFLVDVHGTYINPFNPLEEIPVYERTWYGNYTRDGETYGTKIVLVNGAVQEGVCYVLDKIKMEDVFEKDEISIKDIENFIFKSKEFFVDRLEIAKKFNTREKLQNYKQLTKDVEKTLKLEQYLNREEAIQKKK